MAHRVSYKIFIGPIPDGLWVLHKCDNPPCINPEHLFVGTRNDNETDKVKKGRHLYGKKHNLAKLDDEKVLKIISLLMEGKLSRKEIAQRFSVTTATICYINGGKIWKHLKFCYPIQSI